MGNYSIESDKYTIGNALLWGNCKEHFKKVFETNQTLSGRIIHSFIALLEAIPVVGQIASLAERSFAQGVSKSKPIQNPTKITIERDLAEKAPQISSAVQDIKSAQKDLEKLEVLNEKTEEKTEVMYTVPKEIKEGKEALELVSELITQGITIDRDYIVLNYPKLKEKVGEANEVEARKLINEAYLNQLKEKVAGGLLPIPQSLLALLKHHHKEGLIQDRELAVREEMRQVLDSLPKDKLDMEPIDFVNHIRNTLFECVSKNAQMNEEELTQFKDDLTHLHNLELHWVRNRGQAKKLIREKIIPQFQQVISETLRLPEDLRTVLIKRIEDELLRMPVPDWTQKELDDVLEINSDDKNPTLAERVEKKMDRKSTQRYKDCIYEESMDLLERLCTEIQGSNNWMKKFECEQVLEYCQNSGGNDEILGEGCCFAINLKWGKAIATMGTKKIESIEKLNPKENLEIDTQKSKLLVDALTKTGMLEKAKRVGSPTRVSASSEDFEEYHPKPADVYNDAQDNVKTDERFIQAKFAMEMQNQTQFAITRNLVKKDGFQVNKLAITSTKTIGDNLSHIDKLKKLSGEDFHSLGFLDMGILDNKQPEKAHAIGCKIDHAGGLYRFWDPNYGIFQTRNFEIFCQAFDAFIQEHYEGWAIYQATEIFQTNK